MDKQGINHIVSVGSSFGVHVEEGIFSRGIVEDSQGMVSGIVQIKQVREGHFFLQSAVKADACDDGRVPFPVQQVHEHNVVTLQHDAALSVYQGVLQQDDGCIVQVLKIQVVVKMADAEARLRFHAVVDKIDIEIVVTMGFCASKTREPSS